MVLDFDREVSRIMERYVPMVTVRRRGGDTAWFLLQVKGPKKHIFENTERIKIEKIRRKLKIALCNFVWNLTQISKLSFFLLALLVFDFYSFENKKKNTQKKIERSKFSRKPYRNPKTFHEQNRITIQFYICCANFIKIGS